MKKEIKSVVLYNTERDNQSKESFAKEVIEGLKEPIKRIAMKFTYDEVGSKLCTAILQTPVYYVWRCEKQILQTKGSEILKVIGKQKFNLVDLGAGDGFKTQILLDIAIKEGYDTHYIPLDISLHSNIQLAQRINSKFPDVQITTITAQFEQGIDWINKNTSEKNVYFFLGITFGNQIIEDSEKFVDMLDKSLNSGEIIFLSVDLWKNPDVIARAYSDNGSQHLFILNSLARLNKQLNCNFNLDNFYGYPYLDPFTRMKQGVIISKESQQVKILDEVIPLKKAEVIKCLMSRKWLEEEVIEIFESRGFKTVGVFKDSKQYLALFGFEKK